MRKLSRKIYFKSLFWILATGFFLVSAVMGSFVASLAPGERSLSRPIFGRTREAVVELDRLGLLQQMPAPLIAQLVDYQWETGKTLAEILEDETWCERLGLKRKEFKVTWYLSNPYQVLPMGLQKALQTRATPFKSTSHFFDWCRSKGFSASSIAALKNALIETTPINLWRAAHGMRPYAKNGEYLEPIAIHYSDGSVEVRDGHIATDPREIPTNSEVLLLVRVDGKDRILKVKAADVGGSIKGRHVDLPFQISPDSRPLPFTIYPSALRNPSVQILIPRRSTNLNQKA